MPIRISSNDGGNSSEVITREAYEQGRAHFNAHYFHAAEALPFGGQDFSVLWDDLSNAVNQFVATAQVPLSQVALRFVHCFNISNNELYLRLQICTMQPVPLPIAGHDFYPLDTSQQAWYKIQQDSFTTTPNHTMIGVEYFQHFFYKEPHTEVLERLADGGPNKYTRTLVFPWESEILQMYIDNGSLPGASIHFGACSYTQEAPLAETVKWPHGLVMYLSDASGKKLLNNEDYISIFHYKGADFGTQCPPYCDGYLAPNS